MELGICVRDLPAAEVARLGRFAEDHGYAEIYVPDIRGGLADPSVPISGRDAFTSLGAMFAATSTVRGAVGVAAVIFHHPVPLALTAATLQEQSDGRFTLGVGISHAESARKLGVEFPRSPMATMGEWLDALRHRRDEGLLFGGGWPIMVGALGPRMMALGATDADGVVLNWLTPEHAGVSVNEIRTAAGPDRSPRTVLYVRISPAVAVRTDAVNYDALGNYHQHFLNQGLHGPDDIVAGTCLPAADPARARDRIAEYRESGLDLLCLYPHGFDEPDRLRLLEAITA
ncbi:MAG: LLM class flavin-dependent oxidoreductase [Actinomycetia bacterium]|nr:LLM class flavin-dependent oxidoreductase [Actinomycetes bacterium]